jgi:hypothetical protein
VRISPAYPGGLPELDFASELDFAPELNFASELDFAAGSTWQPVNIRRVLCLGIL